jgi:hypothetical protein
VGVDSAWEQEKLEAWKMLENAAREASHTSGARFVGRTHRTLDFAVYLKEFCIQLKTSKKQHVIWA